MASEVDIANRALQKLGAARIVSLTENSVSARAANACYEFLRDEELRSHPWRFAIRRATLAAAATAPDWGKENSFVLPSDFLALLSDYPERNRNDVDYEIENGSIYTNESAPLYIRYVSRVTDTGLFDPCFCEALSARMAQEMCEEITQSNTKKADLDSGYLKAIAKAKKANAFDSIPQESAEDSWITVRD